jgi:hypothetical protein
MYVGKSEREKVDEFKNASEIFFANYYKGSFEGLSLLWSVR